jgi:aryl-alcohol dehydrogenase-like predicted oxidoreductase
MIYQNLPGTDTKVSKICLGTMTFGEQNSEAEAHEQLSYAVDNGVNFIDTAEMYPVPGDKDTQGSTEKYIGSWLKDQKREDLIIATKIVGPSGMYWIRGETKHNLKNMKEAIETSLTRLQTDYVDLYQVHWPERSSNFFGKLDFEAPQTEENTTPLLETLEALNVLIKEGKVKQIGISNETTWGAQKFIQLAEKHNLQAPITVQNPYCLLNRTFETGLAEVCHNEDMGLLAYSPLGFGVLSGKYLNNQIPKKSRKDLFGDKLGRYYGQRSELATEKYVKLAKRHGLDPAQMALAFVNQRPFTTSNIIGATNLDQLKSNIDSVNVELSKEVMDGIQNIHNQNPNPAP